MLVLESHQQAVLELETELQAIRQQAEGLAAGKMIKTAYLLAHASHGVLSLSGHDRDNEGLRCVSRSKGVCGRGSGIAGVCAYAAAVDGLPPCI
jgi:hypothetical protein